MKYYLATLREPNKNGYTQIKSSKERPSFNTPESKAYSSLGRSFDSMEELLKNEKIHDKPCKCCNGIIKTSYYHRKRLMEKQLCFNCDFWLKHLEKKDDLIIVNGQIFSDAGAKNTNNRKSLGFGGETFFIKKGGNIWWTNNLWTAGKIPKFFIDKFTDNAMFLSRIEYDSLT